MTGDERARALGMAAAADLLGMTRTHLVRLCDAGRVERTVGADGDRISTDEIRRILAERERVDERVAGLESAGQRRRARAARWAGLA